MVLRFEVNESCSFVDKRVVETIDGNLKETIETGTVVITTKGEEADNAINATTYVTTSKRLVKEMVERRWRYKLSHKMTLTEMTMTTRAGGVELTRMTSIQYKSGREYIVGAGSKHNPCGRPSSCTLILRGC